eukprot:TRINITY_DN1498_c0_g2_i1.p1 TRINITY_DN1498_c0_g2~~TRINITY_DN1498_c0_g2_i1.p1  ORF type:complete len:334 (+),score=106.07 TRINITY_DN1498_c0_g2_i1:2-1003(+)
MDVHWVKREDTKGMEEWAGVCEKLGLPGLTENAGRIGVRLDDSEQRKLVETQYAEAMAAADDRAFFLARGIPPHATEESIVAVLEREGWTDATVVARFPGTWQVKFRSAEEGNRAIRCKTTTVYVDDSSLVRRPRADDGARTWAKVVSKTAKPNKKADAEPKKKEAAEKAGAEPKKKEAAESNKKTDDEHNKKSQTQQKKGGDQAKKESATKQSAASKEEEARKAENTLLKEQNEFLKSQVLALTAQVAELRDLVKTLGAKMDAEKTDVSMEEVNDKKRTRESSPPANIAEDGSYTSRFSKYVKRALSPLTHDHAYEECISQNDWNCLRCRDR